MSGELLRLDGVGVRLGGREILRDVIRVHGRVLVVAAPEGAGSALHDTPEATAEATADASVVG